MMRAAQARRLSAGIQTLSNYLFFGSKVAIAIGAGGGIVLVLLIQAFRVGLETVAAPIPLELAAFCLSVLISVGIEYYIRPKLNPEIQQAILLLIIADRSGQLPPEQLRRMYYALFQRVLEQVTLTSELQRDVQRFEAQLAQPDLVSASHQASAHVASKQPLPASFQGQGNSKESDTGQIVDTQDITDQQSLLATYRRTLRLRLQQYATFGLASVPSNIVQEIYETRRQIHRIKMILQSWGIETADHPDDTDGNA